MTTLRIKVVPSSARNSICGWLGDALKLKVRAPAEKGRANRAVIELLASGLGLDAGTIHIQRGQTAAVKTLTIDGIDEAELQRRLAGLADQ